MSQVPRVFISYSHDSENHKDWVLNLSTRLRANGVDVVLDQWGLKLGSDIAKFIEQGLSESNRIIIICTEIYVEKANSGKDGVGYEKMIMTAELMGNVDSNKIIPLVRNNNSPKKTPTFIGGRRYIEFSSDRDFEKKYEELIRNIHAAPLKPKPPLGVNPFLKNGQPEIKPLKFQTASEKYVSVPLRGRVTFDYSNNNGSYIIGTGDLAFETHWSKASDISIHTTLSPSIAGIGLALDVKDIFEITDATRYDMSSRYRTPREREIVVARNQNGYYAALKVLDIKDRTRADDKDELTFEYVILSNRTADFT